MARQGLHIMTFLEGEAKSRLNMSTFTPFPTKEQVLKVLGSHYGDIRSLMSRLIFAYKSLGRIPSHGASRENMRHLVNEHYMIIKGVRELVAEVRKEKSWKEKTSSPGQPSTTGTI